MLRFRFQLCKHGLLTRAHKHGPTTASWAAEKVAGSGSRAWCSTLLQGSIARWWAPRVTGGCVGNCILSAIARRPRVRHPGRLRLVTPTAQKDAGLHSTGWAVAFAHSLCASLDLGPSTPPDPPRVEPAQRHRGRRKPSWWQRTGRSHRGWSRPRGVVAVALPGRAASSGTRRGTWP